MSVQETLTTEKPNIIFIDDDPRILRSLNTIFRDSHNVYTTEDPAEFREKIASIPMDVIVCDQKMPDVSGTELLAEVRQNVPDAMRILLTGYADRDDVLDAINEGEIYRYITKPWDTQDLLRTIADATNIARALRQMRALQPLEGEEESAEARCGAMIMFENEKIFEKFRYVFERRYTPYWAKDLNSALEILLEKDIGIIVSDVHFCGQDVVSAMNVLKSFFPQIMSIVVTQTEDSDTLIDLINYGQVYRALVRPVSTRLLSDNLRGAAIRHRVLQDSPQERSRHQVEELQAQDNSQKLKELIENIRERHIELQAERGEDLTPEWAEENSETDLDIEAKIDDTEIFALENEPLAAGSDAEPLGENLQAIEFSLADALTAQKEEANTTYTLHLVRNTDGSLTLANDKDKKTAPEKTKVAESFSLDLDDKDLAILDDDSVELIDATSKKSVDKAH